MDTNPAPDPTTIEPVPVRDGRAAPSRLRVRATGAAIVGLTGTGGLAVLLSVAATSGSAGSGADLVPAATADPNLQPGAQGQPPAGGAGLGPFGGQPPVGLGGGPGHAASGGS